MIMIVGGACAGTFLSRLRFVLNAPAGGFHFLEAGPYARGNGAARKFDGEDGRGASNECNQPGSEAVVILRFRIVRLTHAGRERREEAIAQQDAQKCSD